jgi:hypothetical protein
VPVVRAGAFGDFYRRELTEFLQTADEYQGEPYAVVDLRGNGGGNTNWPFEWIRRFTGRAPIFRHVLTELISRTTRVGRTNLFRQAVETVRREDKSRAESDVRRYQAEADRFQDPAQEAHWTQLQIPPDSGIANDSTLVVVFDREVASAGEGMLVYLHQQVENVLFVGENSRGALYFGQTTVHQLPNSKLQVNLAAKLNVSMDLQFREGLGYTPDLWVPAADALDSTVAAIRKGTISSRIAIPDGYFDHPFTRENSGLRRLQRVLAGQWPRIKEVALPIVTFGMGLAAIFGLRKKGAILFVFAVAWLAVCGIALTRGNWAPASLFGFLGLLALAVGTYQCRQSRGAGNIPPT